MSDDRSARLWPAIPCWAPPTLKIPGNTFTNRRYQRVELFARGSIDPMKAQTSIALGRKNAINKQHMKMQVQNQCQAKTLDQCHRTCMSLRYLEARLVDQVRRPRSGRVGTLRSRG